MSKVRWQTHTQHLDALARQRDGRPDKAAMTDEQRREAGLMDLQQAAEQEHLHSRAGDWSQSNPVPDDDIWTTGGNDAA